MTLLSFGTGRLAVELAPTAGGSIARFTVDGSDVLRPMASRDVASGKGNNAAAYPLVPYSNRIRNGTLVFEGHTFQLKRNWPGVNHPMHGDGWAHAWQLDKADTRSADIVYHHERAGDDGGWPFRYRARQSYRLDDDRLTVRISADPGTLDALVPNLVLQPLVENAIKHGISRRAASGRVEIEAESSNGTLTLRVRDDGPGPNGAATGNGVGAGIGIRNIRARLSHLYGTAQRFSLADAPGGGA